MGLDQPILVQYWDYLVGIFHADLGTSVVTRAPVIKEFFTLFPATLELSICAMIIAVVVGLPAGIIAAVRRGKFTDYSVMGLSLTGYSMPIFWWGLLLILLFSVSLGWTPVSGRISATYWVDEVTGFMLIDSLLSNEAGAFLSAVQHLILPSIVLATIPPGGDRADDPLGHARGATRRLCSGRPCQRVGHAAGGLRPCSAQRVDSGDHRHRPAGRGAYGRGHPYGDDLLLAGHRQVAA